MDNNLQIFSNEEFGYIRTIEIDGEPWMVGKDICQIFGDKNHNRSLSRIDYEDKREEELTDSLGRKQKAIFINESGLYALLFSMQPQRAHNDGVSNEYPTETQERIEKLHRFKHWVTSEVLPAIRKTGRYIGNNAASRLRNATLPEITAFLHETSSFLREMDKVMREQNSRPSDIAKEFKRICDQFGVIQLSDDFVKEVVVDNDRYRFYTLEEMGITSD